MSTKHNQSRGQRCEHRAVTKHEGDGGYVYQCISCRHVTSTFRLAFDRMEYEVERAQRHAREYRPRATPTVAIEKHGEVSREVRPGMVVKGLARDVLYCDGEVTRFARKR